MTNNPWRNQKQAAPLLSPNQIANKLSLAIKEQIGRSAFAVDGRLKDWRNALVQHYQKYDPELIAELVDVNRLRVPEMGLVLSVNSFLYWRNRPHQLVIASDTGFTDLRFDARCPTGVRGTPPHLDFIAARGNRLVAVTSRSADYLIKKSPPLASAYDSIEVSGGLEPWGELLSQIRGNPKGYRFLDAAALTKFALGLGKTFTGYRLQLIYLFWEPIDYRNFSVFNRHREELEQVSQLVKDSAVSLYYMSLDELWQSWLEASPDDELQDLVSQLRRRYSLAIL